LAYLDHLGRQKLLFPDYIIGVRGEIWIVEAKGGFDRTPKGRAFGADTVKKFAVLKDYLSRNSLKGGLLRWDGEQETLLFCTDRYGEDAACWCRLNDALAGR